MIELKQIATVEELWQRKEQPTGNVIVDAMVEFLRTTRSHQVEDAAILYGVPKRMLQDAVQVFVGVSPHEMISRWRTLDAMEALLTTQLSEEKVAEQCGFRSGRNLCVVVRKYYATTTMAVRNGTPRRNSNFRYNTDSAEYREIVQNAEWVRQLLQKPALG